MEGKRGEARKDLQHQAQLGLNPALGGRIAKAALLNAPYV